MTHTPVLLNEVIALLAPAEGKTYVDCTVGLGGHSKAIIEAAGGGVRLLCIDRDPTAIARAKETLRDHTDQVMFAKTDFRRLGEAMSLQGLDGADGILFDFGVSSPQLDEPSRGFSYLEDAPLDMRMDPSTPTTASDIVNDSDLSELTRIIRDYGEERWASRIAQFVVKERVRRPIETSFQLVDVIKAAIPAAARRTGPHPAKRTFQALRIAVNDELGSIEQGLKEAVRCLRPSGVLCAISFHSLEDRIAKRVLRQAFADGAVEILTKKPIVPTTGEIEENPRARSAKLRAARRVLKAGEVE